ncbi:tetratricopeptide repeat protein [Desulfoferula mesophila]|uniref:Tetratricopeptide repeat protein n=1 Tax=Desulfoferula mesophila TaxID=3058419 RepID=A0AAU9EA75_9BACT|nr:hypothetical protein FAK_05430 [Desulfoferula mesophilus]
MTEHSKRPDTIEHLYHLGNIWRLKGNIANAELNYQQILAQDPTFVKAYERLGLLMLVSGQVKKAREYYARALELDPQDFIVSKYLEYVDSLLQSSQANSQMPTVTGGREDSPSNPAGKICLDQRISWSHHRSGWGPAVKALSPLHNAKGVMLDTAIEANFGHSQWKDWVNPPEVLEQMKKDGTFQALATSEEKGLVPYTEPWVGFIHDPHEMPEWYEYQLAPQSIFKKPVWRKSLDHCRGLFTLSSHLKGWVQQQTGKPVSSLLHPTETPEVRFDFGRFMDNRQKLVVQIGNWLRSHVAIRRLPLIKGNPLGYGKAFLEPSPGFLAAIEEIVRREKAHYGVEIEPEYAANTQALRPLPNAEYDELLAQNLVFLYLFDSAANNTIVECIARATPLLVNPLPAVREYLGDAYPLYYDTLEEAAQKALDLELVKKAHDYLAHSGVQDKITWDYFLDSFKNSAVYRSL